jgi:hypothetical protein
MCKRCGETVDHLLLHCTVAQELWSLVFSMFEIHWVMPKRVADVLFDWMYCFGKHGSSFAWNIAPLF